jgi:putative flippase GtrA
MFMHIPVTFWRFCVVGGIGFLTDAMMLELGVSAGLEPHIARVFSVVVALQVTYVLHRSFTFRGRNGKGFNRWLLFLGVNLVGCAVNYTVFVLVLAYVLHGEGRLERMIALCMSTGVSLLVNYTMNRLFVFKDSTL